jgi:SOS-response transcriptional repressor LexA
MPEPVATPKVIRPTKKQQELLKFIDQFITAHGYSPSYREIMKSLNYTSVATVALHVNNLIKRGHLVKRDRAARSLEVVQKPEGAADQAASTNIATNAVKASEEKWLVEKVDYYFKQAEQGSQLPQAQLDQLYVLVGALKVLGLEGASQSFIGRLSELKKRYTKST